MAEIARPVDKLASRVTLAGWAALGGAGLLALGGAVLLAGASLAGGPERLPIQALLALVLGLALLGLGGLVLLVGLAAYVLVPAFHRELARRNYGSHRVVVASLSLAVMVSNLLAVPYAVAAGPGVLALAPRDLLVLIAGLELSLLIVVYLRIVRPGVITWQQMGLTSHRLGQRALIGIAVGIGLFLLAAAIGAAMSSLGVQQNQAERFTSIREASPLEFGLVLLLGGVLTGFCEETFFRGYVFQAYSEQKGLHQAYLFSSLLFAVVHLDWRAFLPILVVGSGLAFVYRRSGSLIPSAMAHAVNNTISFSILYFMPTLGV